MAVEYPRNPVSSIHQVDCGMYETPQYDCDCDRNAGRIELDGLIETCVLDRIVVIKEQLEFWNFLDVESFWDYLLLPAMR